MSLLFDQNTSYKVTKNLKEIFKGCTHVSDVGLSNSEDLAIWEYGKCNNYAIVTFDSDFYDMSLLYGCPPKIIWLRSGNLSTFELTKLLKVNKVIIDKFLYDIEYKDIACLEIDWTLK